LTNPELDPESFFVTREKWQDLARWQQRILVFNNTFFGRMLLGPWLTVGGQYRKEFARLRSAAGYIGAAGIAREAYLKRKPPE